MDIQSENKKVEDLKKQQACCSSTSGPKMELKPSCDISQKYPGKKKTLVIAKLKDPNDEISNREYE